MKKEKTTHNAKGKASMDQNGEGEAPKYGQAGESPNESGKMNEKMDESISKRNAEKSDSEE